MKNLTIALVQYSITQGEPATSISRTETFIQSAKQQGANVIIFPEDFLTGSIFGDLNKLDRDHHFQNIFQNLAKKYAIDIVAGSWMEDTKDGPRSTSVYVDKDGQVLGTYHKNHLYLSERHFLTPGTEVCVFETMYGKAGIIICWDILFSEIFARMKAQGVEIIYCPSYWYQEIAGEGSNLNSNSEANHLDALCLARAVENNVLFVYANAAGVTTYPNGSQDTLVGHSQICLPMTGTVVKIMGNEEKMIVKTIDLEILDIARDIYRL